MSNDSRRSPHCLFVSNRELSDTKFFFFVLNKKMADNKLYDILGVSRTATDSEIKKVIQFTYYELESLR